MRKRSVPKAVDGSADEYCLGLVRAKPGLLVPHFLMHSYLYYVCDWPIISDDAFDEIVKRLEANWDAIKHPHKALIDRSLLKTGFYLKYPRITPYAAASLVRMFRPEGAPFRRTIDESMLLPPACGCPQPP